MAKIQAKDLFTNSPIFTAKVVRGNEESSATSSAVSYEIECKVCNGPPFKRQGNSTALRKCAHCKTVWDPEDPVAAAPVAAAPVAAAPVAAAPVAPVAAPPVVPVVAEVVVPAKTSAKVKTPKVKAPVVKTEVEVEAPAKELPGVDHYVDLIMKAGEKSTKKSTKKAKPITQHYVTEILDHFDERVDGFWYRNYYCAWYGSNELTFVREGNFSDLTMVEAYEESLPFAERYREKFKIPTSAYAKKKIRTKEMVLKDAETTVEPAVEVEAAVEEETVTIRLTRVITIKKGEPYVAPDGFTWEYI